MKTFFLFFLFITHLLADDSTITAGDVVLSQSSTFGPGGPTWYLDLPAFSADGLFIVDGTNHKPHISGLGLGLIWDKVGGNDFIAVNVPSLSLQMTDVSGLTSALAGKFATPAGTTSQYVRGDGTLATLPSSGTGTVTSVTAGTGLSGGTITTTGTVSLPNTGSPGTYSTVTSDTQGRIVSGFMRGFTQPMRSLNTAFQPSTTQDTFVSYTVDVAATLSLTGGATGTVTLQYADNSAMSTNLVSVQSGVNGNTGTLTIGLALTQTGTCFLTGIVPAGKWVRLLTTNTTGTPTFTYRQAQEVTL